MFNMNKDQLSALLGGLSQGVMAKTRDGDKSWQSQIGALGQQMGQAGILQDNVNKSRQESNAFRNAILRAMIGGDQQQGGVPMQPPTPNALAPGNAALNIPGGGTSLTPDGVPGPTSEIIQKNADGTFQTTIKGNSPKPGVNAPVAPTKPNSGGFNYQPKDIIPFL